MSNRSIGVILLCIWLILYGVTTITNLEVLLAHFLLGGMAIAAAIFLALGR